MNQLEFELINIDQYVRLDDRRLSTQFVKDLRGEVSQLFAAAHFNIKVQSLRFSKNTKHNHVITLYSSQKGNNNEPYAVLTHSNEKKCWTFKKWDSSRVRKIQSTSLPFFEETLQNIRWNLRDGGIIPTTFCADPNPSPKIVGESIFCSKLFINLQTKFSRFCTTINIISFVSGKIIKVIGPASAVGQVIIANMAIVCHVLPSLWILLGLGYVILEVTRMIQSYIQWQRAKEGGQKEEIDLAWLQLVKHVERSVNGICWIALGIFAHLFPSLTLAILVISLAMLFTFQIPEQVIHHFIITITKGYLERNFNYYNTLISDSTKSDEEKNEIARKMVRRFEGDMKCKRHKILNDIVHDKNARYLKIPSIDKPLHGIPPSVFRGVPFTCCDLSLASQNDPIPEKKEPFYLIVKERLESTLELQNIHRIVACCGLTGLL